MFFNDGFERKDNINIDLVTVQVEGGTMQNYLSNKNIIEPKPNRVIRNGYSTCAY